MRRSVDIRNGSKTAGTGDDEPAQLVALLERIGVAVRTHILQHRDIARDSEDLGWKAGDTVFAIDRKVEPIITAALREWPSHLGPFLVVAEGFGEDGTLVIGESSKSPRFRVLIDPIDGTRSLMYDKRSAWFLAAIAPDRGNDTSLSDAVASVMVELPTSKQGQSDCFAYAIGHPPNCRRIRLDSGESYDLAFSPSGATTLKNGFAQVSNFFPGTKQLASELMEHIAAATLGSVEPGQASIFDDQYICTGGQMVELMCGRDRFCCDLRPLFYDIMERRLNRPVPRGLACHPYDIAGLPVAKAAGLILTDAYGGALDAPFNTSTPVHWCGYANETLRGQIAPIIRDWLASRIDMNLA
jgi:fructose-1,6-bisphosphatase/inositol monophosphatase family enzyme